MSEKRNIEVFIQDVFDAIDKINGYVSNIQNAKELKKSGQVYDAVMMNFIVIGEAVKNIYEEVKNNYPKVEWRQIMAMRNILIHEYWGVDEHVVWNAIKKNLPELRGIMTKIKANLD
jgi:uncharacterized protein with HEPN domain